ncbi:MAG: PhoH family protein, partial [Planctomycetota bacterium]|nr:PhoH family protein [Planctomycetota bacterium]
MVETDISIFSSKALLELFGTCDQHIRMVRDALEVQISAHAGRIHVGGSEAAVAEATAVLEKLQLQLQRFGKLTAEDVERSLKEVSTGQNGSLGAPITVGGGREIRARTGGQARYVEAVRKHDLVLCAGPAGTGKTYLAVALAVAALHRESVRKIVLVRPAVEAGESLGYLPGDMQAKINPYLRPLLDALREMMDYDLIKRYQEEDV